MRGASLWMGIFAVLSTSATFGCGGATDSPLLDGGATDDGATSSDGGKPDASSCDTSKCPAVPDGFTLVQLGDKGGCPSGWSTNKLVTSPTASGDACTCACDVTQPSCDQGNVTRALDYNQTATCDTLATTFVANQSGCSPTGLYFGGTHYAVNPVEPKGGSCTYDAKVDTTKLTSTPAIVCAPPKECPGAACDGAACIAHDGDVDCPSSFTKKTLVGTSATAHCSDCSGTACTLAATCAGKLSFFTDGQCTQGEVDFTADGTCSANPTTNTNTPFYAYSYTGTVASATCTGTAPTSTATASLDGAKTICCQ